MPVATRSCSKQKSRPRIEDETPATTNTNAVRRRYVTRSSTKRKILHQENELKDLEPPTKVATTKRSCRTLPNTSTKSLLKGINNTTVSTVKQKDSKGDNVISRCCTSRIPRTNVKKNKTASLHPRKEDKNKENDSENQNVDKSSFDLNAIPDDHEVIPNTPAGCVAARIRSYSALRRSQRKKNNKGWHNVSYNKNAISSMRSPLEEVSFNFGVVDEGQDSDEDILWKMNRCLPTQEDAHNTSSDDEIFYKRKYFTLMTAMKQLQNTFLKAQKNAERSMKVSDRLVSELKSSLSLEKQKCSLLNEEVKVKKGAVERLRSDLENTKEQLEYIKEEKESLEKQDHEKSEKEKSQNNETITKDKDEELRLIEEQRSVINFYSRLTGVTVSCDNTSQDASSFQSFNCTFYPDANCTHGLQFRLTHDKEFDEIEYSPNPRSPGSEKVLKRLPDYLQENIFFGADQAPNFLTKLLKTAE